MLACLLWVVEGCMNIILRLERLYLSLMLNKALLMRCNFGGSCYQ